MEEAKALQVRAAAEAHDILWEQFCAAEGKVSLADVPLPSTDILACVGMSDPAQRYKTLLRRWHPDKFLQKFGNRLAHDQDDVMNTVKATFQQLEKAHKNVSQA